MSTDILSLALRNLVILSALQRDAESNNPTVLYFQICVQSATTNVSEFSLPVLYSVD